MAEPALRVVGLVKRFGGVTATDAVSLDLFPGEIHALIGPNGAGKTTLVSLIGGEIAAEAGRILLAGRDITGLPAHRRRHLGLARSYQITSVLPGFTALDNVAIAIQGLAGSSFRFWRDARSEAALVQPAREGLARVGLADSGDRPVHALSYGQRRQLDLAMTLAGEPPVVLLDEPMAGMGVEESRQIVELIAGLKGRHAVLLVEHDMDAVFRLADRITVLVYGRVIASGTPEAVRDDPGVRRAYLGEAD